MLELYLMIGLALAIGVIYFLFKRENFYISNLSESIKGSNFTLESRMEKKSLLYYTKFKTINKLFSDFFSISGNLDDESFTYYQVFGLFSGYSIIIFDSDQNYQPFDNIKIVPRSIIDGRSNYQLEWIKFNKKFVNRLDNPGQALEIISPTLMEALVEAKEHYKDISLEYFMSQEYQKLCFAVIIKKAIFPIFYDKNKVKLQYEGFLGFLKQGAELKKAI